MRIIRRAVYCLFLALSLFPYLPLQAEAVNLLEEDWAVALEEAQSTGQYLYVAFLGEGWSLRCKRFSEKVLEQESFIQFAEKNFVYCEVKARRSPKLSRKEQARLQSLVIYFDIKSYPTLLIIAPDGNEVLRHGYRSTEVDPYLRQLRRILPD